MKAADYMAIIGKMGKKLEAGLTEDFKDNSEMLADILADVESRCLALQSVVINAFLSK